MRCKVINLEEKRRIKRKQRFRPKNLWRTFKKEVMTYFKIIDDAYNK